jgi:hypothetical protein
MKCVRFSLLLLLTLTISGCAPKQVGETPEDAAPSALAEAQKPVPVDEPIALLLGHGFNEPAFTQTLLAGLAEQFGLASEKGLVLPLVFPADFTLERISLLYNKLENERIGALITLGAPEGTHKAIARLQDNGAAYPVISLASQDDILGTQAGSDLVLDIAVEQPDDLLEEQAAPPAEEMAAILPALLRHLGFTQKILAVPEPGQEILELLRGRWDILPYIDAETGLYAVNHFILKKKTADE